MNKMKTVVIDRKYWRKELLRDPFGCRCCLGFVCEAYGISIKDTIDIGLPRGLPSSPEKEKLPIWLLSSVNFSDVNIAADINDTDSYTWPEKEELLKPIFLRNNIKLVFRGSR